MKIRVLCIMAAVSLFFVQCNKEERREEKAETIIQKELFENLPDYESYEKISISVDTLKEVLLASKEAIELTEKYENLKREQTEIENEINEINGKISSTRSRGQKMFFSGNYHILELASLGNKIKAMESDLSQKQSELNELESQKSEIVDSLCRISSKYDTNELNGWLVNHKFRAKNEEGNTVIYSRVYVMNPDLSEILYQYDPEDNGNDMTVRLIQEIKEMGANDCDQ